MREDCEACNGQGSYWTIANHRGSMPPRWVDKCGLCDGRGFLRIWADQLLFEEFEKITSNPIYQNDVREALSGMSLSWLSEKLENAFLSEVVEKMGGEKNHLSEKFIEAVITTATKYRAVS